MMDDGDNDNDPPPPSPHGDGDGRTNNSFTQIQSRRFRRATSFPCWALCPSMDLVALGTRQCDADADYFQGGGGGGTKVGGGGGGGNESGGVGVAETIAVHRIISWQSLLNLKSEQLTSSRAEDDDEFVDIERLECATDSGDKRPTLEGEAEVKGATSVCWSPDGRYLAIGLLDGGVLIHTVEPDTSSDTDDADGHGALHVIRPPPPEDRPKTPKSMVSPSGGSVGCGGGGKMNPQPFFSPRVTRSMAAARGGGEGGGSSSRQRSRTASKSRSRSPAGGVETGSTHNKSFAVVGMTWNRLTPIHPTRQQQGEDHDNANDLEVRESWRYASQLINRGAHFLPYATKTTANYSGKGRSNQLSSMAHNNNCLNVLCVATPHEIHYYLEGQYRILSIPHGLRHGRYSSGHNIDLVCSPDLSTLLAITQQSSSNMMPSSPKKVRNTSKVPLKAKLFVTTLLPQKRYELQMLSASYRSIFGHLWDAKKGFEAALSKWKIALRPLDTKFTGLLTLLAKYSVDANPAASSGADSIRLELSRFILSGRSTVAGNASSALDQFFTRVQMNDQLLVREARGIEASVASMEGALGSGVLASIRAVVYESEELYGLARAQRTEDMELMDAETALCLYTCARILYLTFDKCLGYVVEARTRLHDLLAWMRGTASQVRAWGTASDSIQRQNARARRISNGVVQRVAGFLSRPMLFELKDREGGEDANVRILTECIIGVPLSDFFVVGKNPTQTSASYTGKENAVAHGTKRIHSLESTVQSMFRISTMLFDRPRSVFGHSLTALEISFQVPHSVIAVHARIGAGAAGTSSGVKEDDATGFFLPRTEEEDLSMNECPFWTIIARSLGTTIEFIAIPGRSSIESDTSEGFYLHADLMIPEDSEVTNIAFYGDDGNSSLSPNLKEGSVIKEGRQSVGFVVKCIDSVSQEEREELWVFQYDDILFQKCEFKRKSKSELTITATELNESQCTLVSMKDDDGSGGSSIIIPKKRLLDTRRKNSHPQRQSQVNLCGSRGTGGVITFGTSTFLHMFDLEEDEDSEEDDEDFEEGGDAN